MDSSIIKIDIFSHIVPPTYKKALLEALPSTPYYQSGNLSNPAINDLEFRFRIMDKFEGYRQVLVLPSPQIEALFSPDKSPDIASKINDELAELVFKYPNKFVAAVACLPMNNVDAALKEVDNALNQLGLKGVEVCNHINDRPLDSPEFLPLWEKLNQYELPIWIHPYRPESYSDYKSEDSSKFGINMLFGWPFETSVAMARLVFSGILEKFPNLKFITHHCGAMVPYFESRIRPRIETKSGETRLGFVPLNKAPVEYFKMFYADTANVLLPALTCGRLFFGTPHVLFGTDMPYGAKFGEVFIQQAITAIDNMAISETEKTMIFQGNAMKLLKLNMI